MTSIKETILDFWSKFLEKEKHRFPNLIPVGIGIGICLYFSLNNEPNFIINIAIFTLLLCFFIFAHIMSRIFELFQKIKFIVLAFLTISLGFLVSQIRTHSVNTFMLTEASEKPISFSAKIETCEKTEKGMKFIVSDVRRKYNDADNELCKKFSKLHLTWIGEKARNTIEDYIPKSRVLFRAILSPIYPPSFPGAYDFKKQQYFKEISARGFIIKPPKTLGMEETSSIHTYIEQLRHRINKEIEKYLSKDTAAITEALITGNTSGITKTIRSNFANSGIAHILAISGLHMGIIGFFIFWIIRIILCCIPRVSMFYDIKKIAACISWIFALFYLYLSGCSISSVRSFIMHTLIMLAILLDRTALTMRSVAIAATLIMLCTPEAIMFPSFQLSFGAVIAIVAFYECKIKFPKFLHTLIETITTTIVASIPTSIISVFIFNQLTLNSVLANIVCIPLMGFFIMPMATISLCVMILGISKPFLLATEFGVNILIKVAEETSKLPGSFFVMHSPTNFVYAIIILSGLWLTLIHHKIRLLGLLGIATGFICYFKQPLPDIFVSRYAKVIGIRVNDCVAFNHLGYFCSTTDAWAKSVGIQKRTNFVDKSMKKYIQKIDNTYFINLKGKKIVVTSSNNYKKDDTEFAVFYLNKEQNEFAQLIYLDSARKISNKSIHRPWS